MKFTKDVEELTSKNPGNNIAFYCNGVTCLKSYKATKKAQEAGIPNVFDYDSGIPAWAKAYPNETLLLSKEITDPEKKLIPKIRI